MTDSYAPSAPAEALGASGIVRGVPEVTEARKAHVTALLSEVEQDKKKWDPSFKRMREDMKFVRKQLPYEKEDDDRAKINVIQHHVKQRVAKLYAKNPTFVAKRRPRLDFAIWDGKRNSLQAAAEEMAATGGDPGLLSPQTSALMADIQQGLQRRRMLDNVGKTLEVLLKLALQEQQPPFKPQVKQLVRRTVVCTVGYIKLGFQRELEKRPDPENRLPDITDQVANAERLLADQQDKKFDETSAQADELGLVTANLQATQDRIVREGLVYDFPAALRIIPDRDTQLLAPGFPGARRVSEEFLLSTDQIKEAYGVDIGDCYTGYATNRLGNVKKSDADGKKALVYEVYDRKDGLVYVVCEGYPNFLKEPAPPPLPYLETFFPHIPLVFNALEEEEEIFPESDIRLMRPVQKEINRKAEAIRQARIAARPLYAARKGMLDEDDQKSMAGHEAHDVIELSGLAQNEKIEMAIQPFPKVGVDPNLYETGTDVNFLTLIVGAQDPGTSGKSGDSATGDSIAENSRLEATASEIDELDDFLSVVARLSSQILLREMSIETVQRVVGPGAAWPDLNPEDIAEEIYLEVEAGSSGRPNRARDLANFERAAPFMLQTPGIDPEWMAKYQIKLLDSTIDYEDAITAGLPSITAMNGMTQVGTGDPATDPNAQGAQGADNQEQPPGSAPGSQPAMPAPGQQPNTPI